MTKTLPGLLAVVALILVILFAHVGWIIILAAALLMVCMAFLFHSFGGTP